MNSAQTQRPSTHIHISDHHSNYYTKAQLQEARVVHGDADKEAFNRRSNHAFLKRLTAELKLMQPVEETAVVIVERFFARRSYIKNDRYLICAAALFLASKAQDGPRPIKHVCIAYFRVKHANKPEEITALASDPDKKLAELCLIDDMLLAERAILYTLGFDVKEYQTLTPLKDYLAALGVYILRNRHDSDEPANDISFEQQAQLTRVATTFLAIIFKTQLMLLYPPSKVVVGVVGFCARRMALTLKPPSEEVLGKLSTDHLGNSFVIDDSERADIEAQVLSHVKEAPAQGQPSQAQQQPGGRPAQQPGAKSPLPAKGSDTVRMPLPPPPSYAQPPRPQFSRPPPPKFSSSTAPAASASTAPATTAPAPSATSAPAPSTTAAPAPSTVAAPAPSHGPPSTSGAVAAPPDVDSPPEHVPHLGVPNDDLNNQYKLAGPAGSPLKARAASHPKEPESPEDGELPAAPASMPAPDQPAATTSTGSEQQEELPALPVSPSDLELAAADQQGVGQQAASGGGQQQQQPGGAAAGEAPGSIAGRAASAAPSSPTGSLEASAGGALKRSRSAEEYADGAGEQQSSGGMVARDSKVLRVA